MTDDVCALQASLRYHASHTLGKAWEDLSARDLEDVVALTLRDQMVDRWLTTEARYRRYERKQLHYLARDWCPGSWLGHTLQNLKLREVYRQALGNLGVDIAAVEARAAGAAVDEGEPGQGTAEILESLATLGLSGYGHGLQHASGLFASQHDAGAPEALWDISRPDVIFLVPVYGRIQGSADPQGVSKSLWTDWKVLIGTASDTLIAGYGGQTVHAMRRYAALSFRDRESRISSYARRLVQEYFFNDDAYYQALKPQLVTEEMLAGDARRLVQAYFLVACAVQDIVRRFLRHHTGFQEFPARVTMHLSDAPQALLVVELMRTLVDDHALPWEEAWEITQASVAYAQGPCAPEALVQWPAALMASVLPRHLQIIEALNRRLLEQGAVASPGDLERHSRMSLLTSGNDPQVRMTPLAIVGSHACQGTSARPTAWNTTTLLPDCARLWPQRCRHTPHGINQRRWLLQANPALADLLCATLGDGWITEGGALRQLTHWAVDTAFQEAFCRIKRSHKARLASVLRDGARVTVAPDTLFDMQVQRLDPYRRQLLTVMHIVHAYLSLIEDGQYPTVPRTYIFARPAASESWRARSMRQLIHNLGWVLSTDARANPWLQVVCLPDDQVVLADHILAAADLSEHLATADPTAADTGHLPFALNGAVILGTWHGPTVDLQEAVGAEHMCLFGLRPDAGQALCVQGAYRPAHAAERDPRIQRVVDALRSRVFCRQEPDRFAWISRALLHEHDDYGHLADLPAYLESQEKAGAAFQERTRWARMAILHVAGSGTYSSDATVQGCARDVWGLTRG